MNGPTIIGLGAAVFLVAVAVGIGFVDQPDPPPAPPRPERDPLEGVTLREVQAWLRAHDPLEGVTLQTDSYRSGPDCPTGNVDVENLTEEVQAWLRAQREGSS